METSPVNNALRARTSTVMIALFVAGLGLYVIHTVAGPFGGNPVGVNAATVPAAFPPVRRAAGDSVSTGTDLRRGSSQSQSSQGRRSWPLEKQIPPTSRSVPDQRREPPAQPKRLEQPTVNLTFFNSQWSTILRKVARTAGVTLVMKEVPPGRFSRYDRKKHTLPDAVRILNRELQPKGFRIVQKGEFLDVMFLRNARATYHRPELPSRRRPAANNRYAWGGFDQVRKNRRSVHHITQDTANSQNNPYGRRGVRPVGHTSNGNRIQAFPPLHEVEPRISRVVATRQRRALDVARAIYGPLKSRARLLDSGPSGLPAFAVYLPTPKGRAARARAKKPIVQFAIGIDSRRDELVVQAPKTQNREIVQLIQFLDTVEVKRNESMRVVPTRSNPTAVAKTLRPQLAFLLQAASKQPKFNPKQPAGKPPQPKIQPGGVVIRGRVTIRDVPGVGLVIIGNTDDVDAVVRIIQELDKQGKLTSPNIEVHVLRHVNSVALSELLTAVYRQLATVRTGQTTQVGTVAFIPVVRPNALLIISSQLDLPAIQKLIGELDRPVDPETEYRVFHLKSAIASQVVANLDALFRGTTGTGAAATTTTTATQGLAARVRLIADVRTNSVIVEARPNDMKIVANLIDRLDREKIESVSRVRVFVLKNAVASELATLINTAIQSVINPAQTTGQPGVGAGVGAGGQSSQALRDVKSSILEFMVSKGDQSRLVKSGILSDIRVTADPRVNQLIVTAPEMSMQLIGALIEQLDAKSALVAEIKVFTLANGDATAMMSMLQTLFPEQTGTGTLGVQVASANDASSGLIPLRFTVNPRTNSIIAVGGAGALNLVQAIIFRLDESDVRQRQTTVVKLKNAPVDLVSTAINNFLTSQRNLYQIDPNIVTNMEILEREIIVVPETVSNSLLISATPRFYEEIKRIVQKLDEAPPQVAIQALMVEVELNNTDEFGVELGFQDTLLFNRGVENILQTLDTTTQNASGISTTSQQVVASTRTPGFGFANQPLGINTTANPSSVGEQGFSNFSLGRVNGDLGFGGLVLSAQSSNISVLLRALKAKRTVHVLSRPQVTTLDNQLAQIQVGQQIPITSGVTVTGTGSANPNISQQSVGIILTVTPRIRSDGSIVMEVVAEKSGLAGQGVPIFSDANTGNVVESPIINITTARTTVAVPNGQTIVIGGMITKSDDTIERKVPWLGDIPILKHAFRYDSTSTVRTELLIFLTPRIVRDDADSELIKQIESERLHFIEQDAEKVHGPLFSVPPGQSRTGVPKPMSMRNRRTANRFADYDDPSTPVTDMSGAGSNGNRVTRAGFQEGNSRVYVGKTSRERMTAGPQEKKSWLRWPSWGSKK